MPSSPSNPQACVSLLPYLAVDWAALGDDSSFVWDPLIFGASYGDKDGFFSWIWSSFSIGGVLHCFANMTASNSAAKEASPGDDYFCMSC